MKVYTYTREQIKAMTAEETKKAIEEIENDAGYRSAYFADRLRGDELKEYDTNHNTLLNLSNHLYVDLNPKYWQIQIQKAEEKIAKWEERKADPNVTYSPANYPEIKIAEFKAEIETYKAKIAELTN